MRLRLIFTWHIALLGPLAGCAAPGAGVGVAAASFSQPPINMPGLVGATPAVLNAEFGQPALRRTEGKAQVWLYQGSACGLNLILYPDAAGTPRVTMAAPTGDGYSAGADVCTAVLERAHVAGSASPVTSRIASN